MCDYIIDAHVISTSITQVVDHLLEVPNFPPTIKTVLWENYTVDKVCMYNKIV